MDYFFLIICVMSGK